MAKGFFLGKSKLYKFAQGSDRPRGQLRLRRPQAQEARLPSAVDRAHQRGGPGARHQLQPAHRGLKQAGVDARPQVAGRDRGPDPPPSASWSSRRRPRGRRPDGRAGAPQMPAPRPAPPMSDNLQQLRDRVQVLAASSRRAAGGGRRPGGAAPPCATASSAASSGALSALMKSLGRPGRRRAPRGGPGAERAQDADRGAARGRAAARLERVRARAGAAPRAARRDAARPPARTSAGATR